MASSSSSSSPIKYQVFLSFKAAFGLPAFIQTLIDALQVAGMNVVYDESSSRMIWLTHTQILASDMSIIVLSEDYASSKLAELYEIMDRKETQGLIVLPIFYHVDPSDVKNVGGIFKKSFEEHELNRPVDEVKRWKAYFAKVGELKGWHIKGGKVEKPEIEYIKCIVDYVTQKLKKPRVFLSFRDEDTRYNFTIQLYEALKGKGLDVFLDEELLEKGDGLSQAPSNAIAASEIFFEELLGKAVVLSQARSNAIAASRISIIVLSEEYASSESCLAELSCIMYHKHTQGRIVLPIFYHVDPSLVRNIGGNFMTSFEEHESNQPADVVKRWKSVFVELGNLKGWHIGGKFDRTKIEHIKDIVDFVIQKLMKPQVFLSFSEDTRLNFTSHLLKALKDKGINVFINEEQLGNREELSSLAVAASNFALIVLSVDYASSISCLVELSAIMDSHHTKQQSVIPIFYHINPSDVQNPGWRILTCFSYRILKWDCKAALESVGKLKGWHIEGGKSDRLETEYIKDIVEDVVKKVGNEQSYIMNPPRSL